MNRRIVFWAILVAVVIAVVIVALVLFNEPGSVTTRVT